MCFRNITDKIIKSLYLYIYKLNMILIILLRVNLTQNFTDKLWHFMSLLNRCQILFVKFEFLEVDCQFTFSSLLQFTMITLSSTMSLTHEHFWENPTFPPQNKSQMKHPLGEVIMLSQRNLITNLAFSVHRPSWHFSSKLAYYHTNCAKRTAVPINYLGSFHSAHRRHNPFKLQGVPIAV